MKKRNKIIAALLVAALGTGIAVAGSGKGCGGENHQAGSKGGSHHRGGHFVDRLFGHLGEHLDLSEEQAGQLEGIKDSKEASMKNLRDQKHNIRIAAMNLQTDADNYNDEVNKLAAQSADLARQVTQLMGASYKQLNDILTVDQRSELKQLMEKRLNRKGHRKHHQKDDV